MLSFPSNGSNPPPTSLDEDIAVVRDTVTAISDAGKDIVIISHSWSALPISSALDGLSKTEREKEGKPGGVVKLIFIAAFVIPAGITLFDAMGRVEPPVWDIQVCANDRLHSFDMRRTHTLKGDLILPRDQSTASITIFQRRKRKRGPRCSCRSRRLQVSARRQGRLICKSQVCMYCARRIKASLRQCRRP